MSALILGGDCRASMRGLPEQSVQAVITSPPYFGQRAYGTEPQVWAGTADCDHRFELVRTKRENGGGGTGRASQMQKTNVGAFVTDTKDRATYAETCGRCGAVRCELGLEPTPELYVEHLVEVFGEVWRVLRDDGVLFLNLGDCFAGGKTGNTNGGPSSGLKADRPLSRERANTQQAEQMATMAFQKTTPGYRPKELMLLPHQVALALRAFGWIVRCDCVWAPSNAMPESARDRPTLTHEYVFVLTKRPAYFWDRDAVLTPYATSTRPQIGAAYTGDGQKDYAGNGVQDPSDAKRSMVAGLEKNGGANLRSVWWFPTGGVDVRKFGLTGVAHYACVDADTEALTREGWKRQEDLRDGDVIAAYDAERDAAVCQPATFNRYQHEGPMVRIEKSRSSQRLTLNHRCLIRRSHSGGCAVVQAHQLNPSNDVLVSAAFEGGESESIGQDWAALAGWFIGEGWTNPHHQVFISQSLSVNAEKVGRIRELLQAVGAHFREKVRGREWRGRPAVDVEFIISGTAAVRLKALAPEKRMTPALALLPREEATALLDALVAADGVTRKDDGRRCIIQKDKGSIDLMQVLAMRLGYRAIVIQRPDSGIYCLNLSNDKWLTLRGTNGDCSVPLGHEHYSGVIWCPSVDAGFWVARRNGKPFITGNSFPEELARIAISAATSEAGACGKCGKAWMRQVCAEKFDRRGDRLYGGTLGHNPSGKVPGSNTRGCPDPRREFRGWQPACKCPDPGPPVPCVVMDIFAGTGTVSAVATKLGRDSISLELNPDYRRIIEARVRYEEGLFGTVAEPAAVEPEPDAAQGALAL